MGHKLRIPLLLQREFRALGDVTIAEHSRRFFKTGPGEYGAGDAFLGIRVPVTRAFARRHRDVSLSTMVALLRSRFHEERLLGALLLVHRYQGGSDDTRQEVFDAYVANRSFVNNWDIVDSSAHKIIGPHLQSRDRSLLYALARSPSLWDRRIAVLSTLHFILARDYTDTLALARVLLDDEHDLIHKAVGWMLREVGIRDREPLDAFLATHAAKMPRTMLRYAIEKYSQEDRTKWLAQGR